MWDWELIWERGVLWRALSLLSGCMKDSMTVLLSENRRLMRHDRADKTSRNAWHEEFE